MSDDPITEFGLSDVMNGIPVKVPGSSFSLRWPEPEEYDDAAHIEKTMRRRLLATDEYKEMKDTPCSDQQRAELELMIEAAKIGFETAVSEDAKEMYASRLAAYQRVLETFTLADELAGDRAMTARDRWLTQRLLVDKDGAPHFGPDLDEKGFRERWRKLPQRVKDNARPVIWRIMSAVESAPFE